MARARPAPMIPETNGGGVSPGDDPGDPFIDLPPKRRVGFSPETQPDSGPSGGRASILDELKYQLETKDVKLWTIAAIAAVVLYFMNK